MSFTEITECRVCQGTQLKEVLSLGVQSLTGVFPKSAAEHVDSGPVSLVQCMGDCGLVQLKQTYSLSQMYGENYGYRSGLNASMVAHLKSKVGALCERMDLRDGDLVVDVGSNDGTTLGFFSEKLERWGIDPSAEKFRHYYQPSVNLIVDFFSADLIRKQVGSKKARLITSFSMFYDLEDPVAFAKEIAEVLDDEGVWCFEQSYMPEMLRQVAYDTVCQEHLEYYALRQVDYILKQAGMKLLDVELNDVNGGSFSVLAAKQDSSLQANIQHIEGLLEKEALFLNQGVALSEFVEGVESSKKALLGFVAEAKRNGKTVAALGASTKGNVLLQYCGLGPQEIDCVGEVNKDKFGCFTPGTNIPILEENTVLASDYDFYLILPWHFKTFFINKQKLKGKTLVFPLPNLEVVTL